MKNNNFLSALSAIGSGIITTLLGGWDNALEIMLITVIMDYLSALAPHCSLPLTKLCPLLRTWEKLA